MTISLDGTDVVQIVESVVWVGSIVAALVVGFIIYLMVRPPRDVRRRRRAEKNGEPRGGTHPAETEEMLRLIDRMESRLEVLERALADHMVRPEIRLRDEDLEQAFAPVEDDRNSGRKE